MGVFAFFLLITGLFHMLAPYAAWYLHVGWKLRDAEPSEGYLAFLRVSGGIGSVVAVIIIVVSFINASRNPGVTDTSWISDVRSKVNIQHLSSMTDGPGFTTDKQLSTKQIIVLMPIIQSDLNEATPLGREMTINGYDGQLNITFNDGSGIVIYDIDGNGNCEIGPLNQNGLGTGTFSFQDSTLASKIEAFQ